MSFDSLLPLVYAVPLVLMWVVYTRRVRAAHRASVAVLRSSIESGMMEPASLHPQIDPSLCLGCGSCIPACPEKNVLGLIAGKAVLIGPANCIGHGACKDACPPEAITLVLGTEQRGVEIPSLDTSFQTNVPGIFVAGELGGMGLIRNAIEQGSAVIEHVRRLAGIGRGDGLDVVIVGAGPAGFAATLAAKKHGLRYRTLEQESLGGTVAHYPRGKIVMTAPASLPLVGKVRFRETTKEALLEFWRDVEQKTQIRIHYDETVSAISRDEGGFLVESSAGSHRTRAVVLAVGRRGMPRTLGVPGEERSKVVYRLVDPEQFRGRHVLVVGGGDSALEAAVALADQPDTTVSLSYRAPAFSRAKQRNRERVDDSVKAGRLSLMLESQVEEIGELEVVLRSASGVDRLKNDAVIICAGGVLPSAFLRSCGIEMDTVHGAAVG